MMNHNERFSSYQETINTYLDRLVAEKDCYYQLIFKAMRYSLLDAGKRIRPVLVLEFARLCGVAEADALPYACALEMIHTYSLIHDDLPCMDDDELRRGRPTSHIVFGEATATLAGDALLNKAFEVATAAAVSGKIPPENALRAIKALCDASGADGMIGGQIIDMEGENRNLPIEELRTLHRLKTGALIRAGAVIPCMLAGVSEEKLLAAIAYTEAIGLAFQMQDDILDVEGDTALLGKATGADAACGKSTFVNLLGLERCKEIVCELTQNAVDALAVFDHPDFLIWLAKLLAKRDH